MNPEINGIDAMRIAHELSQLPKDAPNSSFVIAFYPYNRVRDQVSSELSIREGCRTRKQLPKDKFSIDSDNYFLFEDKDGNPKTCYRILWRFVGFPPDYKLRKINWV
jgi:hypothetical protein